MGSELQRLEQPATAVEMRAQVNRVQEVMKAVMRDGTHFGTIPGTNKPTLYKAGSEILLATFHIACEPEIEDLSTSDEIRYRVRAKAIHQQTGIFLGSGVGECSSSEEKYRWRAAVCDEEWNETPEDRRRNVWKKGSPPYQVKQVRMNPADIANTVLKMAKKRAQMDMTLTVTAASDVFTQDIEDLPVEYINQGGERKPVSQPKRKSESAGNGGDMVEEVKSYTGGPAEKTWTRYDIFIGGEKHATFDSKLAELAEKARLDGVPVKVTYDTNKFGRTLKTLELGQATPPPEAPKTPPASGTITEGGTVKITEAPAGELPGMGSPPSIEDLVSMVTDKLMLCNDGSGGTYAPDVAQGRLDALLKDCKKGKLKIDNLAAAIAKNSALASELMDAAAERGW